MRAVIMAGGSGTRFWPFSREARPKQFLKIAGDRSMIEETCHRIASIADDRDITIVLGKNHFEEASEIFKGRDVRIIAEPVGRNTAPCIGLGALFAGTGGSNRALAFLPADHFIGDRASFLSCLQQAEQVAEQGGIVTLGIIPTRPETGYGYIHRSESKSADYQWPVYRVSAFTEKPDITTAEKYLRSGDYFWNAGIFVATPETILKEIEHHLPGLFAGLTELKKALQSQSFDETLARVYTGLDPVSFDYGIMEKTETPVHVIPCDCGWSDVGSWESLYELKRNDWDNQDNFAEGRTLLIDSRNNFISGMGDRLVACLGIENCIVIDTKDALLVADLKRSQDIRKIIEHLKARKNEDLL